MITRRHFLQGVGICSLLAMTGCNNAEARPVQFVSGIRQGRQYGIAGCEADGHIRFLLQAPVRLHGGAFSAAQEQVLVVARRPGRFAWLVNVRDGHINQQIEAPAGHFFSGHGCFSPGGQRLMIACQPETLDVTQAAGRIQVYQKNPAGIFQPVWHFSSGGIEPHQFVFLSDDRHLAIANGGILTDHTAERRKLNLNTMRPNLSVVDWQRGVLVEQVEPEHHQLSLRHLDCVAGQLWVSMQYQGRLEDDWSLVARYRQGRLEALPGSGGRELFQYTASIAGHEANRQWVVSCPRAGKVLCWRQDALEQPQVHVLPDPAGITARNEGFVISTGTGALHGLDQGGNLSLLQKDPTLCWDNHLISG